jgi:anthranilate phosphoribosyltransferase
MTHASPLHVTDTVTLSSARAFMEACLDPGSDPQAVGEALCALNRRPFQAAELTAFAQVLGERARPFNPPVRPLLDIVGTGGDARNGVHTANLSTLACLTLAGMGVQVAKHGSRAASSLCGSADLLEALGLDLGRAPEQVQADLARTRFAFLFAPNYHPVLARMVPIRKALGVPTVFNMLGPLINPARPEYQVLGVARAEWLEPVAAVLAAAGVERAVVAHGLTAAGLGLDEASLEGPTVLLPVRAGQVQAPVRILPGEAGVRTDLAPRVVASREDCVRLARGLAGGRRHPDFCPRVAEEVALQAALGLMLVLDRPVAALPALVGEVRAALQAGLPLPSLLALAA